MTKYHILGDLKQWELIASQFWEPEVQNQGFYKAKLPLKALGKELVKPLS